MSGILWAETLITTVCLWLTLSVLWRGYRIDRFRHRLFKIRGRLTLMVADGQLSADDITYKFLRSAINGTIHRAEHINFLTWTLCAIVERPPHQSPFNRWKEAVSKLPNETQRALHELDSELSRAFGIYLISGSITMCALTALYILKQALKATSRVHLRKAIEQAAEKANIRRYENAAYRSAELDVALQAA